MRTVAVLNQKGGSGKTTTAVNVAACLAEQRQRVVLVDLDAQGNASHWLDVPTDARGLADVFTDGAALGPLVADTPFPRLSVVPSSPFLLGVERALAAEPGAETLLRRAVERLPATDKGLRSETLTANVSRDKLIQAA